MLFGQTALATSAVKLFKGFLAGAKGIRIKNASGATVFIGPSGVTTTTGYGLENGKEVFVKINDPGLVYGVSSSGTPAVSWLIT